MLLHPLDFLDGADVEALKFFPGMNLPAAKKNELLDTVINVMASKFNIVGMREHADLFRNGTVSAKEKMCLERI